MPSRVYMVPWLSGWLVSGYCKLSTPACSNVKAVQPADRARPHARLTCAAAAAADQVLLAKSCPAAVLGGCKHPSDYELNLHGSNCSSVTLGRDSSPCWLLHQAHTQHRAHRYLPPDAPPDSVTTLRQLCSLGCCTCDCGCVGTSNSSNNWLQPGDAGANA